MRLVWEILTVIAGIIFLAVFWSFITTRWWVGAILVIGLPALIVWDFGVEHGRRHPAGSIFDRTTRDE